MRKNMKFVIFVLILYALAYLLLFGSWVAIVFNKDKVGSPDQMISYIQVTLGALTGHVLTMINSGSSIAGQAAVLLPPAIPNAGGDGNS